MRPLSRACLSPMSVFCCNYVYLLPFPRCSVSNNGMTLQSGLEVTRHHWHDTIRLSIDRVRVQSHWIRNRRNRVKVNAKDRDGHWDNRQYKTNRPRSGGDVVMCFGWKVAIRKLGYSFLYAFHSNCLCLLSFSR